MTTPVIYIADPQGDAALFSLGEICERCGVHADIVVEMGDGVEIAMIEVIRPDAMDEAFADEADEHRVRAA